MNRVTPSFFLPPCDLRGHLASGICVSQNCRHVGPSAGTLVRLASQHESPGHSVAPQGVVGQWSPLPWRRAPPHLTPRPRGHHSCGLTC